MKYLFGFPQVLAILTAIWLTGPRSASGQWSPTNGPYALAGGSVTCFVSSDSVVFAGGDDVYLSKDSGKSWRRTDSSLRGSEISVLFYQGKYLFAGGYFGYSAPRLLRSSNNGKSWFACNSGLATDGQVCCFYTHGNDLYLGTTAGCYKSVNNGDSWYRYSTGMEYYYSYNHWIPFEVYQIVATDSFFYAVCSDGLYHRTEESSWQKDESSMGLGIKNIARYRGKDLIATMYGSFYGSAADDGVIKGELIDGALQWSTLRPRTIDDLSCLAVQGNDIVVGTAAEGVLHSIDNGLHWHIGTNGLRYSRTQVNAIAFFSNTVLIGTADGIARSTDHGYNWTWSDTGRSPIQRVKSIAPTSQGVIAINNDGAFQSFDQQNWKRVELPPNDIRMTCAATSGDSVLLGTDRGVYLSTNAGVSWGFLGSGLDDSVTGVGFDDDGFVAGAQTGEFSYSVFHLQKGQFEWQAKTSYPYNGISDAAQFLALHGWLYAACDQGIMRSQDHGATWHSLPNDSVRIYAHSMAIHKGALFIGAITGLWKFEDDQWSERDTGRNDFYAKEINCVASNGSRIVIGTMGGGFISDDDGATWTRDGALNAKVIRAVTFYRNICFAAMEDEDHMDYYGTPRGIWKQELKLSTPLHAVALSQKLTSDGLNLKYNLDRDAKVTVSFYDILGIERGLSGENFQQAGQHIVQIPASVLVCCFVKLRVDAAVQVYKCVSR